MGATYRYRPEAPTPGIGTCSTPVSDVLPASSDVTLLRSHGQERADPPPSIELPGFEIREVLGRGGLGVVYRAWQPSLARDVAIKVMARQTPLDASGRLRFRWEAEAAARLQHPNFVQVFEIREHDGLDFIVLELVAGGTLKQFVGTQPQPFADAARLMETLSRAVHQAHLHGIVHRDLKPENILLTTERVPKISDFGLAKRMVEQGGQGTIAGTAFYMAPEQAFGSTIDIVGPPADVYSLGVILYELLTGRVPLRGSSFQQTMVRVWSERPMGARAARPDCPPDLEAICSKCLEKEPEHRYPSAEALADDLRRYLAGEPVSVREISSLERAAKWAHRRPTAAALVVLAVTSAALLIGGGAWYQTRLERALAASRANLVSAQDAIDRMIAEAGEQELENVPGAQPLQHSLLAGSVEFCRKLVAQNPEDRAVRQLSARAQRQLADLDNLLGDRDGSRASYDRAVTESTQLADDYPGDDAISRELAVALNNRGNLLESLGQMRAAREDYQAASTRWSELRGHAPADDRFRAGAIASYNNLGRVEEQLGDWRAALATFENALDLVERGQPATARPVRQALATAHNSLGVLLHRTGNDRLAAAQLEAGLRQLAAGQPSSAAPAERLLGGSLHHNLAIVAGMLADDGQAQAQYAAALEDLGSLHRDHPRMRAAEVELAAARRDFGMFLSERDPAAGIERLEQARKLYDALLARGPSPDVQLATSLCLERLGRARLAQGDSGGQADLEQAHRLADALVSADPNSADYMSNRAAVLASEGEWLASLGKLSEARRWLEQAIAEHRQVRQRAPQRRDFARQLAREYLALADVLCQLGDVPAAAKAGEVLASLGPVDAQAPLKAGRLLARCASLSAGLKGNAETEIDGLPLAEFCARRSVDLLAQAVTSGGTSAQALKADPQLAPLLGREDFQKLITRAADGDR